MQHPVVVNVFSEEYQKHDQATEDILGFGKRGKFPITKGTPSRAWWVAIAPEAIGRKLLHIAGTHSGHFRMLLRCVGSTLQRPEDWK